MDEAQVEFPDARRSRPRRRAGHLAPAAFGHNVWWITAIGQEATQTVMKPQVGIPDELSVLDIIAFGPAAKNLQALAQGIGRHRGLGPVRSRSPFE